MPIKEDILTILGDPKLAIDRLFDMHERAQRYDLLNEVFIKRCYAWLYEKIDRPTVLIDIGANIGDTPIYFSTNPNIRRIFAYEPYPYLYNQAKSNTRGIGNIELINRAISDRNERKPISAGYKATAKSRYEPVSGRDARTILSQTIDDAITSARRKGTGAVAIKCDCEGCEATIFEKARLGGVYAMQIEYHATSIRDALLGQLKGRFSTQVRKSDYDPNAGFVFAWR